MHTFFPSRKLGGSFILSSDELRHLKVRRIKKGQKVGAIWEEELYLCELEKANRKEARLRIIEKLASKRPGVSITLIQAVPVDIRTFEIILQKSTELGVSKIIPLITERSFNNVEVLKRKAERWEKIIREAMKQSKRAYPLKIMNPLSIEDLEPIEDLNIILDNFSEGKKIKDINYTCIKSISLVVGPEGGFSISEIERLKKRGFINVKLEPHILRTETAAIVGVGIIVNLADL